ncbi:hypothetical protein MRB53_002165 [Persea americana]|uniref:Uncharacterized protein n=1 Tax=Persea americana TaxID=3435 RepID=A0ACC2MW28_PERAE|nr:hypothetical protein MRB53_002165 [Persea americana]
MSEISSIASTHLQTKVETTKAKDMTSAEFPAIMALLLESVNTHAPLSTSDEPEPHPYWSCTQETGPQKTLTQVLNVSLDTTTKLVSGIQESLDVTDMAN